MLSVTSPDVIKHMELIAMDEVWGLGGFEDEEEAITASVDGTEDSGGGDTTRPASPDSFELLLPSPSTAILNDAMSGGADHSVEVGSDERRELLSLPTEILHAVASWLNPKHGLQQYRLACKALCRAADHRMDALSLSLSRMPSDNRVYQHLSQPWHGHVHHVTILESEVSMGRTEHRGREGCSPVCLWLLMFGPHLTSLSSVTLDCAPYLLEAMHILKVNCPQLSTLEVVKSPYHEMNRESFWQAVNSFKRLKKLLIQNWVIQLPDLNGIQTLTHLEDLHIKASTNYPTGLRCLSLLSNLRHLTLEEIEYPATIPGEFCGLSQLTLLETVRFVTVGPLASELFALCSLSWLRTLEISQHYDEALIPALYALMSSVSSLELVRLPQFVLSDGLARHLALQPNLRELVVGRYLVTRSAVPAARGAAAATPPGAPRSPPPQQAAAAATPHGWPPPSSSAGSAAAACSAAPSQVRMPSLVKLTLKVPDGGFWPHQHQDGPLAPIAAVMPNLQSLNLQQLICRLESEGTLEPLTELFSTQAPLSQMTSLRTCAPMMAVRELVAGCSQVRHLVLDACYPPAPEAAIFGHLHHVLAPPPTQLQPHAPTGVPQIPVPDDSVLVAAGASHQAAATVGSGPSEPSPDAAAGTSAVDGPAPGEAGSSVQQQQQQQPDHGVEAAAHELAEVEMTTLPADLAPSPSEMETDVELEPSPANAWLLNLGLLRHLERLELKDCFNLTLWHASMLTLALPGLTHLTLEDLSQGTSCLGALRHNLTRLKSLTLRRVSGVSAKMVVQLVHGLPSMTVLTLDRCQPVTVDQCSVIMKRFAACGRHFEVVTQNISAHGEYVPMYPPLHAHAVTVASLF